MSALPRKGNCNEPGPYDQHCNEDIAHRWSCYDHSSDSSWNDRSPEGWQEDTPHDCEDEACMTVWLRERADREEQA